jgi:hypothetical protein
MFTYSEGPKPMDPEIQKRLNKHINRIVDDSIFVKVFMISLVSWIHGWGDEERLTAFRNVNPVLRLLPDEDHGNYYKLHYDYLGG